MLSNHLHFNSVKILNRPAGPAANLTDPIFIMLRAAPFHHELSFPRPVWWDADLNGGAGGWSLQGCHYSQLLQGMLLFACNRLGYYGLLQNRRYLNAFAGDQLAGARFRYSPVAIYVGCATLFVCCWLCIVSYVAGGRSIRMPRRARHALVNTWLALAALAFVFGAGIYQTEEWRRCRTVGMAVHYFSLCVLLWICVAVSNMYKRMSRQDRGGGGRHAVLGGAEDSHGGGGGGGGLSKSTAAHAAAHSKPIMGVYLVGWGIAMIICGISGSVNIHEYASYAYCFLRSGPALSALFVPAGILVAFVCILFACIRCSLAGGGGAMDHSGGGGGSGSGGGGDGTEHGMHAVHMSEGGTQVGLLGYRPNRMYLMCANPCRPPSTWTWICWRRRHCHSSSTIACCCTRRATAASASAHRPPRRC